MASDFDVHENQWLLVWARKTFMDKDLLFLLCSVTRVRLDLGRKSEMRMQVPFE